MTPSMGFCRRPCRWKTRRLLPACVELTARGAELPLDTCRTCCLGSPLVSAEWTALLANRPPVCSASPDGGRSTCIRVSWLYMCFVGFISILLWPIGPQGFIAKGNDDPGQVWVATVSLVPVGDLHMHLCSTFSVPRWQLGCLPFHLVSLYRCLQYRTVAWYERSSDVLPLG